MKTFLLCIMMLGLAARASAGKITVQGHLANGGTSTDGDRTMVFTFYADSLEGTNLWSETRTVHVQSGLFTCVLGLANPIPDDLFTAQRWLETTVDGTTLSPRIGYYPQPVNIGPGQWHASGNDVYRNLGRVSIGTSNFETPLLVQKDIPSGSANLVVLRNSAAGGGAMALSVGATGTYPPENFYGIGDETDLRLSINRNTGNVGIGTTTPTTKLSVNGTARIANETGIGADPIGGVPLRVAGFVRVDGGAAGSIRMMSDGAKGIVETIDNTPVLLQPSGGNVGIGTTAPTSRLHVMGDVYADNGGSASLVVNPSQLRFRHYTDLPNYTASIEYHYNYNNALGIYLWGDNRQIFGSSADGSSIFFPTGNVTISGGLTVNGTKCRAVEGTKYGTLYYNAVESGNAIFTTSGRARLVNGRVHIELDPKWLTGVTINDQHRLDVTSLVFYGEHGNCYAIPGTTGFDVVDPSGSESEFFWTVQAAQKGYEARYLDQGSSNQTVARR